MNKSAQGLGYIFSRKGEANIPVHLPRYDGKTRCGRGIPEDAEEITVDDSIKEFDPFVPFDQRHPEHLYLCGGCVRGNAFRK